MSQLKNQLRARLKRLQGASAARCKGAGDSSTVRLPALPLSHGKALRPSPNSVPQFTHPFQALQERSPGTPVPAHIPPAPAAAVMQSPHTICHTNPSLTAYPFSSLCAPGSHKSSMKQQGVKENKNSCRDKGVRLSPGPDPGQGAWRSHIQAILGLDLVSEHLMGSERKRTQAGGRASPAPQIISTADSQMLICHFR